MLFLIKSEHFISALRKSGMKPLEILQICTRTGKNHGHKILVSFGSEMIYILLVDGLIMELVRPQFFMERITKLFPFTCTSLDMKGNIVI